MDCVDLFAGAGGASTGLVQAGARVLWAANHWPLAVETHAANHPETVHSCQDLHQADFYQLPDHDLLWASPCCQGHSRARGKEKRASDKSRSTAWAVISAAEAKRPGVLVIENVPEFEEWALYPAWRLALQALGYSVQAVVLNSAEVGAPQSRSRLYLIATRSTVPIGITIPRLPKSEWAPASNVIDFDAGRWSLVNKPGRAPWVAELAARERKRLGDRFVFAYYGSTKKGQRISRPFGTMTTRARWGIVDGGRMRMLQSREAARAMTLPDDYVLLGNERDRNMLVGNGVTPVAAAALYLAIEAAA